MAAAAPDSVTADFEAAETVAAAVVAAAVAALVILAADQRPEIRPLPLRDRLVLSLLPQMEMVEDQVNLGDRDRKKIRIV